MKDFTGFNLGTDPLIVQNQNVVQLKPTQIYLHEQGSITNEPSFSILMTHPTADIGAIGQLSLEMWNEGLKDVGYKIVKI